MSSGMPTDQLARVLRKCVPDRASPGLDGRIMATVVATPQRRLMPRVVGTLAGEPESRRKAMLVVAALLPLAALAGTLVLGALSTPAQGFRWLASRQSEDWPCPLGVETAAGSVRDQPLDHEGFKLSDKRDGVTAKREQILHTGLTGRTSFASCRAGQAHLAFSGAPGMSRRFSLPRSAPSGARKGTT